MNCKKLAMNNPLPNHIVDFSENLLVQLLELKNEFPWLTFWLRSQDNQERLSNGLWFQGTEDYLFIGLVKLGSSNNRTKSIGFIVEFDSSGNILWDKTIGGYGEEDLASMYIENENHMVLIGSSLSDISGHKTEAVRVPGHTDAWLVELHTTVGIEAYYSGDNGFSIYPNPATSTLFVESATKIDKIIIKQAQHRAAVSCTSGVSG